MRYIHIFLIFLLGESIMTATAQSNKVLLPSPKTVGKISLEETLTKRRSIRSYKKDSLTLEEVSQLLWAAQGITQNKWGGRTAPSAGATYPLEIYIIVNRVNGLESGLYHYFYREHVLKLIKAKNLSKELCAASLRQEMIEKAAINIIITAEYSRTTDRYGERGRRYVHMEVGHVGQNIYLQAQALGLGTVVVGAFNDEKVQSLLGIDEEVLYIMPVGRK
jgi:SagB-type dehydrogenase family enzyme